MEGLAKAAESTVCPVRDTAGTLGTVRVTENSTVALVTGTAGSVRTGRVTDSTIAAAAAVAAAAVVAVGMLPIEIESLVPTLRSLRTFGRFHSINRRQ